MNWPVFLLILASPMALVASIAAIFLIRTWVVREEDMYGRAMFFYPWRVALLIVIVTLAMAIYLGYAT